jgi:hypothetical protein
VCLPSPLLPRIRSKVTILIIILIIIFYCSSLFFNTFHPLSLFIFSFLSFLFSILPPYLSPFSLFSLSLQSFSHHSTLFSTTPSLLFFLPSYIPIPSSLPPSLPLFFTTPLIFSPLHSFLHHSLGWWLD